LNQSDKQVIQETITHLREEVKEMERSAWLYETVNEQAINV